MTDLTRRRFALALAAVLSIGVALRALPLWQSPLPFNPDGIIHARNAEITVRTGEIPLAMDGVFADDLAFASFLATLELLTGVGSLRVSQPVIAVVGTIPALLAVVLARRFGRELGWSRRSIRAAGLLAGALLAFEGMYLYRSMPVDEQTAGLVVVPLAVLAVVYGLWTDDRRWLVVAIPLLVSIPPLHNLESVLVGLSLAALAGHAAVTPGRRRTTAVAAGALAVGFWVFLAAYNTGVESFTPTGATQNERVTERPGLLLAWVVFAVTGVAWFGRMRDRTQRVVLLAPFLVLFGLLSVNATIPVFPGLSETPLSFLLPTLALVLPVVVACWGYPVAARPSASRAVLVGLFAGPLTMLGFVLSADLTPVYFATGTRTHWFLHLPVMGLAAAGAVVVFRERLPGRKPARVALAGVLVCSVVVSVPIAFGGLSVYSYQGVTTPGEFSASTFAHERVPGTWASDDHLVRISQYHPPNGSGTTAPVYSWVHDPDAPPPDCAVVTKDSWSTVGAQFYPRPPASLDRGRLDGLDRTHDRVYHGGSTDGIRLFRPTSVATGTNCE